MARFDGSMHDCGFEYSRPVDAAYGPITLGGVILDADLGSGICGTKGLLAKSSGRILWDGRFLRSFSNERLIHFKMWHLQQCPWLLSNT